MNEPIRSGDRAKRALSALALCLFCACNGTPNGGVTSPTPTSTVVPIPPPATNIAGTVTDTNGRAVADVNVEIVSPPADRGISSRSNAQGQFQLRGIQSTTFTVRFSHAQHQLLEREYTFQLGTQRNDLDARLTLIAGAERQDRLTIQIGTGVDQTHRATTENFLRTAQDALSRIYGERTDRIFVGVFSDIEEMLDVYLPYTGLPSSQRDFRRNSFRQFPSFSGYRAIWRGLWSGSQWTQATWIHEYTHVLQWELSENARGGRAPRWLEEGHATLVERRVPSEPSTEQWRTLVRQGGINYRLIDIEGDQIFELPNGYLLGGLAAEYLRVRSGDGAMAIFWKQLARSSWQAAFQTAFGLTPGEFYEAFERFR